MPWDFYLYVALTLLRWDYDFFLKATPNLWLKQWILWLKANNPEALDESGELPVMYMKDTPFF